MLIMTLVLIITMALISACGGSSKESAEQGSTETQIEAKEKAPGIGTHHAEIEVEGYGTIKLELDGDEAPLTVQNFMDLAESGFYDGLTFHRIMDGFMIQGGDPNGDGTGGSDTPVTGEFAVNGIENNISHKKGVISMARRGDSYDSGSSQFFICVADSEFLDGQYAGFGHVTEGQDVADKIASDAEPIDNNGTVPPENQPVITKITIID